MGGSGGVKLGELIEEESNWIHETHEFCQQVHVYVLGVCFDLCKVGAFIKAFIQFSALD